MNGADTMQSGNVFGHNFVRRNLGMILLCVLVAGSSGFSQGKSDPSPTPTLPGSAESHKRKWRVSGMGDLESYDGEALSFTAYKSSDGSTATVIHAEFSSEARATAEFDHALGNANKIVSQGPLSNAKGDTVGRRATIFVASAKPGAVDTAIVWTDKRRFVEIVSPSKTAAEEWEMRFRNKGKE